MVEFISKIEKAHAMLKDALIALHKTPAYLGGELMSDKELEMYDKAHLANSTFNKAFLEYRR